DRDYLAYDGVPLVGKLYPWSRNLYVATAYRKWGLSNGTAAAMILCDTITGKENPWAATFDATRLRPVASIPRVAFETAMSVFK
ncbi:MAG TPA: FAD-dependent oxidoreductase, partial [Candidatus Saccharimonadales bacterium]|nr:FAD-dependent oxidoreductase [Candidatus Saccharimonadales bacterium]